MITNIGSNKLHLFLGSNSQAQREQVNLSWDGPGAQSWGSCFLSLAQRKRFKPQQQSKLNKRQVTLVVGEPCDWLSWGTPTPGGRTSQLCWESSLLCLLGNVPTGNCVAGSAPPPVCCVSLWCEGRGQCNHLKCEHACMTSGSVKPPIVPHQWGKCSAHLD